MCVQKAGLTVPTSGSLPYAQRAAAPLRRTPTSYKATPLNADETSIGGPRASIRRACFSHVPFFSASGPQQS